MKRAPIALLGICLVPAILLAAEVSHQVTIQGMRFTPATIVIKTGDSVSWANNDDRDHQISAADGSFKSPNLGSGQSYEHKFTKAGTYPYTCSYHPRERGAIIVKD